MKEQFVTYEIALKLKELRFDECCLAVYFKNKFQLVKGFNINNVDLHMANEMDAILAPLWQQVIDWLKEKHGIFVFIDMGKYYDSYAGAYPFQTWCKIYKNKELINSITVRNKLDNENFIFYSYEEAREQAILKAIELIKE